MSEPIQRRTPGESRAYSDGYLSAMRYAAQLDGVSDEARKKLRSLIEVHELFCRAVEERKAQVTP